MANEMTTFVKVKKEKKKNLLKTLYGKSKVVLSKE
tara:strand:+ start:69 stop:173 length:105 start_codon:yes stop_codon:yes gene_type:complete